MCPEISSTTQSANTVPIVCEGDNNEHSTHSVNTEEMVCEEYNSEVSTVYNDEIMEVVRNITNYYSLLN